MLNFFKKGLKWKLSLGVVICTSIAALSGLAGIISLGNIQADMKNTTLAIDKNIDRQVDQINHLMPLQATAVSIVNAESVEELAAIESSRKILRGVTLNRDGENVKVDTLLAGLLTHKRNQLESLRNLSELSKSYRLILSEVSKHSINIVDNAEFDSEIKILDAIAEIEKNIGRKKSDAASMGEQFNKISGTAGSAISTVKAAAFVKSIANELSAMVNEAIGSSDSEYIDYVKIQVNTLLENIRSQLSVLTGDDSATAITLMLGKLAKSIDNALEGKKQTLLSENELKVETNEIWKQMSEVQTEVLTAARELKSNADDTLRTSSDYVKKWQSIVLFLVVASMIMAIITGIYISTIIVRPLNIAVNMLEDIAEGEGDLTARLDIQSRDEIGELAQWFNVFIEKLQEMITDIAANASQLYASSETLSALSNKMVSFAEEVQAQSTEAAISTEEMSANISSIATAAEEMSTNVQNVSSTAEQMSQNVDSVASAIEENFKELNGVARHAQDGFDIAEKAKASSTAAVETIELLGNAAKDISDVTSLIKRIAEQTNLLALNATIEAASAGDAGKGFAVVANEIKELASQSSQAAQNIAGRVTGVQNNTEEVVKVIDEISNTITQINESSSLITKSVDQQKETASEISSNVVQSRTGTNNIASSIAEVATGSNDMAKSAAEAANGIVEVSSRIQDVNQAANESNALAENVNISAVELAKVAGEIQKMVGRFKV